MKKVVSWFSAGVSSAYATKIAIDSYGCKDIYYIHIDDEHPDNVRFIKECEEWFGLPIHRLQSEKYKSVNDALACGYINGPTGASCTSRLKKDVRKKWEKTQDLKNIIYVWGLDCSETNRVERINIANPECENVYPLIDKGINKETAHGLIKQAGIKRPVMYDLGFNNNNCIGCVKGGKGYWNLIRKHFPDVFKQRAEIERKIGASCIKGCFLDELKEGEGNISEILEDCGIFCEIKEWQTK